MCCWMAVSFVRVAPNWLWNLKRKVMARWRPRRDMLLPPNENEGKQRDHRNPAVGKLPGELQRVREACRRPWPAMVAEAAPGCVCPLLRSRVSHHSRRRLAVHQRFGDSADAFPARTERQRPAVPT